MKTKKEASTSRRTLGRPPMSSDKKRGHLASTTLTSSEGRYLRQHAEKSDQSVAGFVRDTLRNAGVLKPPTKETP